MGTVCTQPLRSGLCGRSAAAQKNQIGFGVAIETEVPVKRVLFSAQPLPAPARGRFVRYLNGDPHQSLSNVFV